MSGVICKAHRWQRVYLVCNHVVDGAEPFRVVAASGKGDSAEDFGEVLCRSCHENADKLTVEDLSLACEACILKRGWVPN